LILIAVPAFILALTVCVFFPLATAPYHGSRLFPFFFLFGILLLLLIVSAIARLIF
jgi:uncharacterized membrane protein